MRKRIVIAQSFLCVGWAGALCMRCARSTAVRLGACAAPATGCGLHTHGAGELLDHMGLRKAKNPHANGIVRQRHDWYCVLAIHTRCQCMWRRRAGGWVWAVGSLGQSLNHRVRSQDTSKMRGAQTCARRVNKQPTAPVCYGGCATGPTSTTCVPNLSIKPRISKGVLLTA